MSRGRQSPKSALRCLPLPLFLPSALELRAQYERKTTGADRAGDEREMKRKTQNENERREREEERGRKIQAGADDKMDSLRQIFADYYRYTITYHYFLRVEKVEDTHG